MKGLRQLHSNSVWPPLWLVVVLVCLYLLFDGAIWLIGRSVPPAEGDFSMMREFIISRCILLSGAAVMFAAFRLIRFHPVCNRDYADWLRLTPWTSTKPLPLGPVHLVWQDAFVVAVIAAIARWPAHVNPVIPIGAFGLAYLAGMTGLLIITRQTVPSVILGFLWPALALPAASGLPRVVILCTIVVAIGFGYCQSLRTFPWQGPYLSLQSLNANINIPVGTPKGVRALTTLGWPFATLSPKPAFSAVSIPTSLRISLLLGWWAYCVITSAAVPATPELLLAASVLFSVARIASFWSGVTTPFNLWGRIVTGRLIVPGFDCVFRTPMAAVLIAAVSSALIRRSGPWHPLVEACAITLVSFILLSGGPTMRKWHLTGHLRLIPPRTNQSVRRLVRQV